MDTSARIYYWGFTHDERQVFDAFLQELSAPQTIVIEPGQGYLPVHDILFSDKLSEEELTPDQKVLLFFNVPAETIQRIMKGSKTRDVPRPIYAMVTRENISWTFSDLVEHLKKEHAFVQKRLKEKKEKKS
ncbi:MAG TPA: DUF3783 domain-containing protein [Desulfomonilia bacterium]|nr:DUF3783 domain-containing protein [Thermodesulfobacteriota bacterium]HWR67686.1 DUF3783 domain-containing protein [Desulfomonilia bacterium]